MCKDFFSVKRMFSSIWLIWRVVAITFSHRKQCLIATSFDIVPSAPLHFNQNFCFYLYLNITFSVKRMFSSIWLIWRVVAITFSHRKQCLIATSFDIVPSAPLHFNQNFCFYLYLNIKKLILLVDSNNLYKLQTLF